jgi:hypothetical protein
LQMDLSSWINIVEQRVDRLWRNWLQKLVQEGKFWKCSHCRLHRFMSIEVVRPDIGNI